MRRILSRRSGRVAVGAALSAAGLAAAGPALTADPDLIARGKYVATASDCAACHTAPGGLPMAGGLPLATPIGAIISTNITPSKEHGIGSYTLGQFDAAVRRGVRADGGHLYPAMPYTAYALLSDEDIAALYAYVMEGVAPVETTPPETDLPFPFGIRLSMAAWNLLFLDKGPFEPDPARDAEWNRGAYLVRGPAHCGTCHTPRNLFMAERLSQEMAGGAVGPWYAPNITSDANSGIGGWSVNDLVAFMRDGHVAQSQAAGPMAEAIDHSLRFLTEDDLKPMAVYLKSVAPVRGPGDTQPVFSWGAPSDELASVRGAEWPQNPDALTGPQIYDAYCATCHQADGQGSRGLPSLVHNTALGRENTDNLVMVVLDGLRRQPDVLMPRFGDELSDTQIATLGTYVLQHFGNPAAKVTSEQVATLRAGGSSAPWLLWAARLGLAAGALIAAAALMLLFLWTSRKVGQAR